MKRWISVLFITTTLGAAGCATTSGAQPYANAPTRASSALIAHSHVQDPAARVNFPVRENVFLGADRPQGVPTPEPATPPHELAGPVPQIPIPGRWGSPAF